RPCTACMDEHDLAQMVRTHCSHWYCRECLKAGLEASLASRSIFKCCLEQIVDVRLFADLLTPDFVNRYNLLVLERATPNPTYCAQPNCSAFIPPDNYHGPDSARCSQCRQDTCRHCRASGHAPLGCTSDPSTEQVRKLAGDKHWMTCPGCQTMVEKTEGCLHIVCECKTEFCYRCGGIWTKCRSDC
ncbi:uncharacterized protein K460DRAFT_255194, partial [Cucurbitaria berberidis CBS 394.84]